MLVLPGLWRASLPEFWLKMPGRVKQKNGQLEMSGNYTVFGCAPEWLPGLLALESSRYGLALKYKPQKVTVQFAKLAASVTISVI